MSPWSGARDASPPMQVSPAIAGPDRALFGPLYVFALAEGAVADLAQRAGVVVEAADLAPVDLVGMGVEMIFAEGLQPLQHCIDLDLGGKESVRHFGVVGGGAASGHGSILLRFGVWAVLRLQSRSL